MNKPSKVSNRCSCGGIMNQEIRFNSLAAKDEIWFICPFCQNQQPSGLEASTQIGDTVDRVLTQPTRG